MNEIEIEQLAKALFERENDTSIVTWDAVARQRVPGQSAIPGAGEDLRDRYRKRIREGER